RWRAKPALHPTCCVLCTEYSVRSTCHGGGAADLCARFDAPGIRRGRVSLFPRLKREVLALAEKRDRILIDNLANHALRMPSPPHLHDEVGHRGRLARPPIAG